MLDFFKNLMGSVKKMPRFQVLVGALCFRNWRADAPANKVLGFGMLTALEEGLRGETASDILEEVLESSADYKNSYYLCPLELFGEGHTLREIAPLIMGLGFAKHSHSIPGPLKVFLVDRIRKELINLLALQGQNLTINLDSFEGLVAIAFKMGLLYFQENPNEARKLAAEPRAPNPFA